MPEQDTPAETPAREEAEPNTENQGEEFGGPRGMEPTRYGDWEKNGRCIDF